MEGDGKPEGGAKGAGTTGEAGAAPLEPVGDARRERALGVERWHLPDPRVAERLIALGARGIGGFEAAPPALEGTAAAQQGLWIARKTASRTLGDLAKDETLPWHVCLATSRDVARALRACEQEGLFPGPLTAAQIVLDDAGAWIKAESLVRALAGARGAGLDTGVDPKWTPPEQASGAPWDGAANRYVLGLAMYRMLSGTLPFGGAGLRHAFEEQRAGAPPFPEEIACGLRPGVQALVLRLLAGAAGERPANADAIVRACEALLGDDDAPAPEAPRARSLTPTSIGDPAAKTPARKARPAAGRSPSAPRPRASLRPWVPLGVALAVALVAIFARARRESPSVAAPVVRPVSPLRSAGAEECAPCHAREVGEWERSVMAHSVKSPLFGALESLVEEEVGREDDCPNGAGILRPASGDVCRARRTGISVTGAGGERWCVSCHSPGDNLDHTLPAWAAFGPRAARAPARDLLSAVAMEGISCASCHETVGPVAIHAARARGYEGNATWQSVLTGEEFLARPEDLRGLPGIANSGYRLDASSFLGAPRVPGLGDPVVHRRASPDALAYRASSEFCGACHDVRLFGSDAIAAPTRGEHFKRLRNAYSEWRTWADAEARAGRRAPTCQGCHMSLYPGVCAPGAGDASPGCPGGTHFEARAPGLRPQGFASPSSGQAEPLASHYFTSVDLPLTPSLDDSLLEDRTLDADGQPVGLRGRRDLLMRHTFAFGIEGARRAGSALEIPVTIENTGAGHRVPAGFSQERETWVELVVKDARGAVVYQVGAVDERAGREVGDLRDKTFLRVTTGDDQRDGLGRPLGLFGADVVDGPDVPRWSPSPTLGGTRFRGRGLINLQNGFLRCVRCIGTVDERGECQPGPGQGATRADRYEDGFYDADTGECRSNLSGGREFFETYFPVGALDADRGLAKAPDAIIDTRSAPPGVRLTYTYDLDTAGRPGPFRVSARLRFRSFPPYLVRAFAAYEARRAREGLRPSGPQVDESMLRRIEVLDLATAEATVP